MNSNTAVSFSNVQGLRALKAYISFYRDPLLCMKGLHEEYGDALRIESPIRAESTPPSFLLTGEFWNRAVLTSREAFRPTGIWPVGGPKGSALEELRKNYLVQHGAAHAHFSKVASPAFDRARIGVQYEVLAAAARDEIDGWPSDGTIDCSHFARRLMQKLAFCGLFGEDDPERVRTFGERIEDFHLRQWQVTTQLFPVDWPYSPYRRLLEKADGLRAALLNWTDARPGSAGVRDLRACFRDARSVGGGPISEDEKAAHMAGLILASYETAAATLSWALMLLAHYPSCLQALAEEARLSGPDGDPLGADRDRPAVNGLINETLRLFPPVPFLGFRAVRDTEFQSIPLRRNALVFLSVLLTQRDPGVFADPWAFRPDRWREISPNTYQFPAFSGGARRCPGFWFATVMLRYVLSYIAATREVRAPSRATFNYRYAAVMRPKGKVPLELSRRKSRPAPQPRAPAASALPALKGNVYALFRHSR